MEEVEQGKKSEREVALPFFLLVLRKRGENPANHPTKPHALGALCALKIGARLISDTAGGFEGRVSKQHPTRIGVVFFSCCC